MLNRNFNRASQKPNNIAATTISWFMHGEKFRLVGSEQARV